MMPGGLDPKKMQAMMKQMGIKSEDIASSKVTIETDSGAIIIEEPQVVQVTMQGQVSFQISGKVRKEIRSTADDVKMVMEQAGCSEDDAKNALEKSNGDIAEAILSLSKE